MARKRNRKSLKETSPEPQSSSSDAEVDLSLTDQQDYDGDGEEEILSNPSTKKHPIIDSKIPIINVASPTKSTIIIAGLPALRMSSDNEMGGTTTLKNPSKDHKASTAQEDGSKKLFQRVFSEEDEIMILKGIIEYSGKEGSDLMDDPDDFYAFIKKLLHVDVKKGQILDKIRRLKKKFTIAKSKKMKFTNEHDQRLFDLSKKIWDKTDDDSIDSKDEKNTDRFIENVKDISIVAVSDDQDTNLEAESKDEKITDDQDNNLEIDNGQKQEDGMVLMGHDDIEEDLGVGENIVNEKVRKRALRKMGVKGRAEIDEMWEKVAKVEWKVRMLREEVQMEETKRIMEALGWGIGNC
ncbi:GLABROUS1 enhancer-binding protein-like [Amaranthus tricolor]|uniref:GLABROUS1 enhancer-binding protein-like n=1 Tax=Amaranthus tricolor TaxID=29722 RepID=UPI002586642A|nr:GLABROUS1 enhancer-binding protein-like [Amaranthus tricolor]XP_057516954.1 GLABROUS1 enhancer-binding protein-like [Amaranthus tricolor]